MVTKKWKGWLAVVVIAAACAPLSSDYPGYKWRNSQEFIKAQTIIHCFSDLCLVEISEEQLVEGINDTEGCAWNEELWSKWAGNLERVIKLEENEGYKRLEMKKLNIVLGAKVTVVNQTDKNLWPHGSYILKRVRHTLNTIRKCESWESRHLLRRALGGYLGSLKTPPPQKKYPQKTTHTHTNKIEPSNHFYTSSSHANCTSGRSLH